MENFSYFSAFLFGFFGSTHCIGMCGSIITILSFDLFKTDKKNILYYQICYNFSRICSYGIIGLIAGFFSFMLFDFVNIIHFKMIKIFSSVIMIFLGLHLFINFNLFHIIDNFNNSYILFLFNKLSKKILLLKSPYREILLGLIWGNIPCGLVYGILSIAILSGSIYKSFFLMFFFGVGTLPAMLFTPNIYIKIFNKKLWLKKVSGIIIIFFGIFFLINTFFSSECHKCFLFNY